MDLSVCSKKQKHMGSLLKMSLSPPDCDCPNRLMGAGAVPSLPIGSGLHHHNPRPLEKAQTVL